MQRLVNYADELVTSIGPRPGGSNGEHEAAELIATNLEDLGLDTWIQDFPTARNTNWLRILYYMLGVLAAELFFAFPQVTLLAAFLAIVAVVLLALDLLDFDPLFNIFAKSSSQNVIARYVPDGADPRRKVVVVAHYDAGRTLLQGAPAVASIFPLIEKVIRVCLVALALFVILALFPFPELILILLSVLAAIIGVILFLAALVEVVNLIMPYSHGANCNASGVAAVMGIAEVLTGARTSSQESSSSRGGISGLQEDGRETTRRRSPRATTLAKVSGATGDLFSKAKDMIGRKSTKRDDASEQDYAHDYVTDGYGEAAGGRRLRSAAPTTRVAQREPDVGRYEGASQPAAPLGRTTDAGTADLGQETVVAARASRSRIEKGATENPAIRVRETLAEREEQERAFQDQAEEVSIRTKDGLPSWFVDAKNAAKKETERGTLAEKEPQVARSRFADDSPYDFEPEVKPTPKRARRTEQESAGEESSLLPRTANVDKPVVAAGAVAGVPAGMPAEAAARVAAPTVSAEPKEVQAEPLVQPEPGQKSVPLVEPPTTLNADFSGIDRLTSDPMVKPPLRSRLPKSASSLEHAVATKAPDIPAHGNLRNLPTPSLGNSGSIPTQQAAFDQHSLFDTDEQSTGRRVSSTGSFAPLGVTGIMKPVGDELLQYHDDEQDIYIDDADLYASGSAQKSVGGHEPRVMEIPRSRSKSFFGNLGDRLSGSRKNETFNTPATTWLGVDEDFDARTEGSQIGGWDNFSEEGDDDWKGGAYGGESYEHNAQALAAFSSVLIDREVWLVAVGSHECRNAGVKTLLAEYERDLKSALVINLDGIGAGDLCFTMAEGSFIPKGTDHRLQSLVQSAADALGIAISPAGLTSYSSDAAVALASGYRAISVVGLGDKLPVGWRWSSDRLDVINENSLQEASELVIEIIKSA